MKGQRVVKGLLGEVTVLGNWLLRDVVTIEEVFKWLIKSFLEGCFVRGNKINRVTIFVKTKGVGWRVVEQSDAEFVELNV